MEILRFAGLGVTAAVLALMIRSTHPAMALNIGIAAGILLFLAALGPLSGIIGFVENMAGRYGIDAGYIGVVLKVIGVAYIAEFAVQICKDAGENAVAGKVELGGKVLMLSLSLPVMGALLELVGSLLGTV